MENTKQSGIDRPLLIESLVIICVSLALFGVTFTFDRVPEIFSQGIQPTVFPRAVLAIMIVLAVLQAVKATRLTDIELASLSPYKPVPRIVYLTGVLLIIFVASMRYVGTFPTLIAFCPALFLAMGRAKRMDDAAWLRNIYRVCVFIVSNRYERSIALNLNILWKLLFWLVSSSQTPTTLH